MSEQVTRIGKYQIIEQVGEGAMGVVYRALDPVLNRAVAVKVMSEGMAQDEALRQRFLREAQAAGSLQHPNVVTIYDFGETDGHLYIAMEYIEGTDLEKLLSRGTSMPLTAKLDIIVDVLNGLSYAHRRGIVHRDIKPANIRIDMEGHARIMDFGVAHLASSNLTGTGVMMGTPNYMAPEQITSGDVTAASDLFSVGAVLYELLTNTKPFAADTLHRVLFRIVSDPPPDLLAVAPDLPPALEKVVKKALAKEVGERYATANEMANDLSAVRASLGAPRASRTVSQRSSIEKALLAQRQAQERHAIRRWQAITAAAAALLVVGGGGSIFFVLRSGTDDVPSAPAAATQRTDSLPQTQALPNLAPSPSVTTAGAPRDSAPPLTFAPNTESRTSSQTDPRSTAPRTADADERRLAPRPVAANPEARRPAAAADSVPTSLVREAGATPPVSMPVPSAAATLTSPLTSAPPLPVAQSATRGDSASQRSAAVPESPRTAIANILAAYATAIGSRDVRELRRVYNGMTDAQQSAWESFFSSVRSMTAALEIASLETSGATAVARITGAYEFITRAGRAERQPASFEATFVREGERWRLQTIR